MRLSLKVSFCPTCLQTGYLTVEETRIRRHAQGRVQEKKRRLVRNAILRADDLTHLRERIAARDAEEQAPKPEEPNVSPEPG